MPGAHHARARPRQARGGGDRCRPRPCPSSGASARGRRPGRRTRSPAGPVTNASTGLDGVTTRSPAVCAKYASGDSLWCSTAPMPPPNGRRTVDGHRACGRRTAQCMLGELDTIWSNARYTKPSNWISHHRPVAAHRQADRGADDRRLRERGVDDAQLAEVLLQAVGHAEDAAERPMSSPMSRTLASSSSALAQAGVERLRHRRVVGHQCSPPANDARYSANSSRSLVDQRVRLGVDVVEHRVGAGSGSARHAVAQAVRRAPRPRRRARRRSRRRRAAACARYDLTRSSGSRSLHASTSAARR